MADTMSVKVSGRYQISLPSAARGKLNIQKGDRLLVDIQDGLLILTPEPDDFVAHLEGLHREIWNDADAAEYISKERDAWTDSSND
jgi:AbrB family looped-hinge helix DNA binding protein